jgi:ubiquinol-cytochrome c reductase cytochrome b subunit
MARSATAPGVPTTQLGKAAVELDERFVAAN